MPSVLSKHEHYKSREALGRQIQEDRAKTEWWQFVGNRQYAIDRLFRSLCLRIRWKHHKTYLRYNLKGLHVALRARLFLGLLEEKLSWTNIMYKAKLTSPPAYPALVRFVWPAMFKLSCHTLNRAGR